MTRLRRSVFIGMILALFGFLTPCANASTNKLMLLLNAGRIGLNAESMASLGMTDVQAVVLLSRLEAYESSFDLIQQYETEIAAHTATIRDAESTLRLNPDDQHAEVLRFAAENDRSVLQAGLNAQRAILLENLTSGLAVQTSVALVCRAQAEFLALDAPLRLGVSTAEQAKEAAWALRMEARAQAGQEQTPAEAASVLSSLRAQSLVSTAIASRNANLASVEQAVNTWLSAE